MRIISIILTGLLGLMLTFSVQANPKRIGYIVNYGTHEWYQNVIFGLQSRANELGIELEVMDANLDINKQTQQAEDFMTKLKDLFEESYIEVPEGKVDMVDDLADQVEELEKTVNESTKKAIDMAVELEGYKRDAIIREATKDLAETQVEKLKKLAENVDFEDEETFTQKVAQLKESYFAKKITSQEGEIVEDDTPSVETSDSMASYLNAIKKTQVK